MKKSIAKQKPQEVKIKTNPNTGSVGYEIPWNKLDNVIIRDNEGDYFLFLEKLSYKSWWIQVGDTSFNLHLDDYGNWKATNMFMGDGKRLNS